MSKFIPIIFSLFFSTASSAIDFVFKKSSPVELEIALSGLRSEYINNIEYEDLKKNLKTIDGSLRILTKPISSFIIKTETYKTILEFFSINSEVQNYIEDETFTLISRKLKSEKNNYSKFSLWLINSLLADGENLIKIKTKKMTKKDFLISYWLKIILQFSPHQFNKNSSDLAQVIISNMALYLNIAATTSTGDSPLDFKKLQYIEYPEKLPKPADLKESLQTSAQEQLEREKMQRKESAKKLVDKISLPKTMKSKDSQPPWKPKDAPKQPKSWLPKEQKEMSKSESIPILKQSPKPKGKVYKLDDL